MPNSVGGVHYQSRTHVEPRHIVNPDERPLNPPISGTYSNTGRQEQHVKPVPTVPRNIIDPDERLLNPPVR